MLRTAAIYLAAYFSYFPLPLWRIKMYIVRMNIKTKELKRETIQLSAACVCLSVMQQSSLPARRQLRRDDWTTIQRDTRGSRFVAPVNVTRAATIQRCDATVLPLYAARGNCTAGHQASCCTVPSQASSRQRSSQVEERMEVLTRVAFVRGESGELPPHWI